MKVAQRYIAHRINTIEELQQVPSYASGVELDLRDKGDKLILVHDPFKDGQEFEEYLKHYHHGLMILNIKSERIEYKVKELIDKYGVTEYFYLDSSFPMINLLSKQGEKNMAVRFSELEGIDTVTAMKGRVEWVWVDCFTKIPLNKENYKQLKDAGFKLAFVSPDLYQRVDDIEPYREYLLKEGIVFDVICCKHYNIHRWEGVAPYAISSVQETVPQH